MTHAASRFRAAVDLAPFLVALAAMVGPVAWAEESETGSEIATPRVIQTMDIGGVDARSAALLLSGQTGGDVAGELWWTLGETTPEGLREVPFVVEIDGATLLAEHTGDRLAIGLFAYIVDEAGQIATHLAQGVILESDPHAGLITQQGLKILGRTAIGPGVYSLRVMVRTQDSRRFFLTRSQVAVPGPDQNTSASLAPLFPDPGGNWVTFRQRDSDSDHEPDGVSPRVPAARPVLIQGRPTEFFVVDTLVEPDSMEASFLDSAGRILAEYPIDISTATDQATGLRPASLPIVDLPPGRYTLVLETRDGASGVVERQTITVALVPTEGPYTWLTHPNLPVPETAGAVADRASEGFRRRRARTAYIEALRTLADGDATSAREQLMEIERLAWSHGETRGLRRVEDAISDRLADHDPRCLLPIALLHQQLVRRYVARHEFVLASFARSVAADRAGEIANHGGDPGFAAALLVILASDMARTASPSLAISYLEKAIEIDPSSRAALLALGVIYERSSDFDRATRVFRQLVDKHPDFAEGRLRLAVNLARTGRQRAAEKEFQALLERQTSEWILAITVQEYARLLIDHQRREDAQDLLLSSSSRLPNDQRLQILLAYTEDFSGRSLDAVEALLQIPPATAGVSPRVRYTEWPNLGSGASANSLRSAATDALPSLAEALESKGGR